MCCRSKYDKKWRMVMEMQRFKVICWRKNVLFIMSVWCVWGLHLPQLTCFNKHYPLVVVHRTPLEGNVYTLHTTGVNQQYLQYITSMTEGDILGRKGYAHVNCQSPGRHRDSDRTQFWFSEPPLSFLYQNPFLIPTIGGIFLSFMSESI